MRDKSIENKKNSKRIFSPLTDMRHHSPEIVCCYQKASTIGIRTQIHIEHRLAKDC